MTVSKILGISLLLLFTLPAHSGDTASSHLRTVEQFIAAFNAHDSSAMAEHVADDIDWLSISGDKIAIETRGKNALITSLDAYFKSCPTCQSSLSEAISAPSRISAIEIASWKEASGPRTQRSLSVYEFSDGLIRRVYYFPAEK